jgi:hypothetical protein
MKKSKAEKLVWFARTSIIVRMGPYKSQAQACSAIRGYDGNPVPNAFVWCETKAEYARYKKMNPAEAEYQEYKKRRLKVEEELDHEY